MSHKLITSQYGVVSLSLLSIEEALGSSSFRSKQEYVLNHFVHLVLSLSRSYVYLILFSQNAYTTAIFSGSCSPFLLDTLKNLNWFFLRLCVLRKLFWVLPKASRARWCCTVLYAFNCYTFALAGAKTKATCTTFLSILSTCMRARPPTCVCLLCMHIYIGRIDVYTYVCVLVLLGLV